MNDKEKREQIRQRADSLTQLGSGIKNREKAILKLMDEHGITNTSALKYWTWAKRRRKNA